MKKSIFKNSIFNAAYNLLTVVFPLVTIPYISRVLLANGLGKINYSANIVSWFVLFASLGIPRYGIREIASKKNSRKELNKSFSELFWFNFISTTICSLIYVLVIINITFFREHIILYCVTGIQLFLNIFNVDWFYQGMEEYEYITKRSFIVKAFSLIAMFVFVKTRNDYVIYALIQSLAVTGNYIFNFIYLKKFVNFSFNHLNLRIHVKSIFVLLSTSLAVSIYAMLDTTMLGILCNDAVVGYYTNVHKIINTISVVTASLGGVMLPRLVEYYSQGHMEKVKELSIRALQIIVVICTPITIGIVVLAPQIVSILFGNSFVPAIITMRIFSPFILISTIGNLYGTQLLMTFNKENNLLFTTAIGAIINFGLNLFLIKMYKQNGAAVASVIAELVVMILQIYYVNKVVKINLRIKDMLTAVFLNVSIFIWLIFIQKTISNDFFNIAISVVGAIGIYLILGVKINDITIKYLFNKLKKHISD